MKNIGKSKNMNTLSITVDIEDWYHIPSVTGSPFSVYKDVNEFFERSSTRQTDTKSRNLLQRLVKRYLADRKFLRNIKKGLRKQGLSRREYNMTIRLMRTEITLGRRIDMLTSMHNLLRYWHIAHMPFALVMLIVMSIHVIIVIAFGYKWIF